MKFPALICDVKLKVIFLYFYIEKENYIFIDKKIPDIAKESFIEYFVML